MNLRDLGGLASADGRVIASGRLFRSSNFAEVAPDEEAKLHALGLRTVVDLRGVNERRRAPSRGFRRETEVHHLPIEPRALGTLHELRQGGNVDQATVVAFMHGAYRRMAHEHSAVFAELLQRLLDAESYPLVFHCTAGKDRTGFAAALVLLALNVPHATIVDNFLISNERWKPRTSPGDWTALAGVRSEYLQSAFESMIDMSGSIDAYLGEMLGFDAAARRDLAEQLLIDP